MPGALDVLVELNFKTNEQSLSNASKEAQLGFEKQSNILKEMQAQLDRMGGSQLGYNNKTTEGAKKTNAEYQKLYNQLKKLESENKTYADTVNKLQQSHAKFAADAEKRFKGQSTEVKKLTSDVDLLKKKLAEANTVAQATSGTFSKIREGFLQGIGIGAGFGVAGLVARGVGELGAFISDASRLASETEGVKRAFERLNSPGLLDNLREATKGTVSDLELMKQAVQFNNFGLPVSQLATGLEFARIRAKETGQSVEYLVQSIVTGIGRQSPLILDNLGINAKRVSDEFKKTGDFAQAAFNIIREETEKSGQDLETYAERIASINASIDNQKAKLGQFLNEVTGFYIEVGKDIGTLFTDADRFFAEGVENYSEAYIRLNQEAQRNTQKLKEIQNRANIEFLRNFEQYTIDYAKADLEGRHKIEAQAKEMYDNLVISATTGLREGLQVNQDYLDGLLVAFKKTTAEFRKAALNINNVTPAQIKGLSKEELLSVQDKITTARNPLTSTDTAEIARLNKLESAVKAELDKINGTVSKGTKTREEIQAKADEQIIKLQQEYEDTIIALIEEGRNKELRTVQNSTANKIAAIRREKALSVEAKELQNKLILALEEELGKQTLAIREKYAKLNVLPTIGTSNTLGGVQSDKDIEDFKDAQIKAGEAVAIRFDNENKSRQAGAEAEEERQKRSKELIKQSANDSINSIVTIYNAFANAEIAKTSIQIAEQEKRVAKAEENAKAGNAKALLLEQQRLDELEKKRRDYAERQKNINAALVASQAAVNVVQTVAAVLAAAPGDPYSLPARVAAAVAAVIGGVAATVTAIKQEQQFYKGSYTGDGDPKQEAGVVHKREFVFDHKATDRIGKDNLEALRTGKIPFTAIAPKVPSVNYAGMLKTHNEVRAIERGSNYDMRRLESELKNMNGHLKNTGEMKMIVDMDGITASVDALHRHEIWIGSRRLRSVVLTSKKK